MEKPGSPLINATKITSIKQPIIVRPSTSSINSSPDDKGRSLASKYIDLE